jgi:hypothetical protein
MPSWLTLLCALLAVHLFALEALAERAKRAGDTTLYRAPLGLRILLGTAIVSMVYGAGAVALSKELRRDWWVSVLLLGLAIFCATQWPADLGVSKSGIYEKKWLGLRKKGFLWEDIASSAVAADEDSVWVVARSGTTIKHTKYHVDRAGFVTQIKTHCRWLEPGRAL